MEIKVGGDFGNKDRIRDLYERAIANVPPAEEKRYWQRYIYLWIDYALFEEIVAEDVERTRAVYRECLDLIPHSKFSFAKIWLLAAQFEIRQLNLSGARRILGNAIGKAPKHKLFRKYIEIELHLGNIDRCRKLYARYLEWSPETCYCTPELLWKAYIDFEISLGELERTRALYERLLDRTKHYKVWLSFAKFEASAAQDNDVILEHARVIFDRANTYYKESKPELKEERAKLLEDWLNMEASFGMPGDVSAVQSKLPKKLKKRKPITREDGETEYEEYIDYLFPEESQTMNLKILEAAHKWKKQKVAAF
ncbi:HAT (Half-A-TPR) repeat [Arabidopsis suecica]|uniref:HAT (Half-A-TPR) repeat n=1 Tax=Arabidopsis suecica TaxID=45249 RepID=A0A8T1ZYC1_ARASU|nr:HAT (Half-A-TPR) repeat [Arabidopsis suecica]